MFINSYGNLPNLSLAGAYSNSGPSQCMTPPPCGFDCTDQFVGSMALAASIQLTPPAECPPPPARRRSQNPLAHPRVPKQRAARRRKRAAKRSSSVAFACLARVDPRPR